MDDRDADTSKLEGGKDGGLVVVGGSDAGRDDAGHVSLGESKPAPKTAEEEMKGANEKEGRRRSLRRVMSRRSVEKVKGFCLRAGKAVLVASMLGWAVAWTVWRT